MARGIESGVMSRLLGGLVVAAVLFAYYHLLVAEPRAIGSVDPDRFYHLALAKLTGADGILRTLPQAEDLGWARYFPDKEFLFHWLTGVAQWLGGEAGVLMLVPALGLATALVLYAESSCVLRPLTAASWISVAFVVTAAFLFRLSVLRPHILAVLCFCVLVISVLRSRPRLAALSAFAFAMAYHAFYLPMFVAALAFAFRRQPGFDRSRLWAWIAAGTVAGIVVNPHFPGNVAMSVLHLRLALGASPGEGGQGIELQAFSLRNIWLIYGYYPASVLGLAAVALIRRPAAGEEASRFWFLLLLAVLLLGLGLKSVRAMEYAVPVGILLAAHSARVLGAQGLIWLHVVLLVLVQGSSSLAYYRRAWTEGLGGGFPAYAHAIAQVPAKAKDGKVFNCEWEAGAYLLYLRPDLRFVDLLEPALLQSVDPFRYELRKLLVAGAAMHPQRELRRHFDADYVLCQAPALVAQMEADKDNFQALPGTEHDPVRLFVVRPGEPAPPVRKPEVLPLDLEYKPPLAIPGP